MPETAQPAKDCFALLAGLTASAGEGDSSVTAVAATPVTPDAVQPVQSHAPIKTWPLLSAAATALLMLLGRPLHCTVHLLRRLVVHRKH